MEYLQAKATNDMTRIREKQEEALKKIQQKANITNIAILPENNGQNTNSSLSVSIWFVHYTDGCNCKESR